MAEAVNVMQATQVVGKDHGRELLDLRFRQLLDDAQWKSLPPDTQRRFSKRVSNGNSIVYVGQVTELTMNRAGRWLANLLRLIGAPLPIGESDGGPSVVSVTEDMVGNGQVWTRMYANNREFPQVIHSAKRFEGPTGLEEYVGFGISMALKVSVRSKVLVFESAGYFIGFGGMRLRLPSFLTPGRLTVTHKDLEKSRFEFGLRLEHPQFGVLLNQIGHYREENG